jgi:hypothetical protein
VAVAAKVTPSEHRAYHTLARAQGTTASAMLASTIRSTLRRGRVL